MSSGIQLRALFIFGLAFATPAFSAEIPPDSQVIRKLSAGSFPHVVRLLNWNIKKGEGGAPFTADLQALAQGRNLVTLQEGYESPLVNASLQSLPGLSFYMAGAFVYRGIMTGVITGAASEPARSEFRRSPSFEPVLNSPKMTSLSYYKMSEGKELLVANLHGLNFVGVDKFEAQVKDVAEALAAHKGPLIFMGDFNTWNTARMQVLEATVKSLGLETVNFTRPAGDKGLDHVFFKGCTVEKAEMPGTVKSSDHFPQLVDLKCSAE